MIIQMYALLYLVMIVGLISQQDDSCQSEDEDNQMEMPTPVEVEKLTPSTWDLSEWRRSPIYNLNLEVFDSISIFFN